MKEKWIGNFEQGFRDVQQAKRSIRQKHMVLLGKEETYPCGICEKSVGYKDSVLVAVMCSCPEGLHFYFGCKSCFAGKEELIFAADSPVKDVSFVHVGGEDDETV